MLQRTDQFARSNRPGFGTSAAARGGFTVIEMLVTLAMIIVLVGILVVALSQASGTAQKAQTAFLMNSMSAGLAQFKGDHGYLPPVLGDGAAFGGGGTPENQPGWSRDAILPPNWGSNPSPGEVADYQGWYSVTSPAEYLLGYGNRSGDGYGIVTNDSNPFPDIAPGNIESPTLGFRSPGFDGAWNSIFNPRRGFEGFSGSFAARNPGGFVTDGTSFPPNIDDNGVKIRGRIYGPYLEIKDENSLGGLRPDGTIARPEDPDYVNRPKVILDYWGTPIRYYRRPYSGGDPRADAVDSFDLGDLFAMRPWTIETGVESNGVADAEGDRSTTPQLKSAEFGLLSAGANRRIDGARRFDTDELNRDNIQEIGP